MTRTECEHQIIALVEQAAEIYRRYNPTGTSLTLLWSDGFINVSDIDVDSDTKEITMWTIDSSKHHDGAVVSHDYDKMTVPA